MITLIYLSLTVVIVLTNLIALGVLVQKVVPERNLARFIGIVGISLVLFFIEHLVGLGDLAWVWPLTTALSVYVLWRHQTELVTVKFWWPEAAFVLGFIYALAWRFLLPDINPVAEEMTDLYFVANYRQGVTLPPPDMWLSGYNFDFYYAFQHYAIALYGRIFDFNVGVNYNLAWPIVAGSMAGLAWSIGSALALKKRWNSLFSATVLLGGSGVTVFSLLIWNFGNWATDAGAASQYMWASVRAIGGFAERANGPLGELFYGGATTPMPILPIETTAYLLFNGDLHPPLGGFLLALGAGASMFWMVKAQSRAATMTLTAFATATAPLMIAVNAWVFPLHALFVLTWLGVQALQKKLDYIAVLAGGAVSIGLLLPFLSYFSGSSLSPELTAVQGGTPWQGILQWWPLAVLLPLLIWKFKHSVLIAISATIAIGLGFTLFAYFSDGMGGQYARFNTALKWWSYLNLLMVMGLALGLSLKRYKWLSGLVMVALLSYVPFSLSFLLNSDHNNKGVIAGHAWFTSDPSNRDLLNYLDELPAGIMLEAPTGGAYTFTTRYALFSEHQSYIGWHGHQGGWLGRPNFLNLRAQKATRFYSGQMSDIEANQFVDGEGIDYIIWGPEDVQTRGNQWTTVDDYLSDNFAWVAFYDAEFGGKLHKVGVWQRVR